MSFSNFVLIVLNSIEKPRTRQKVFELCQKLNIIIQSWVGHKIGSKVTSSVYTKHNPEIDFKYIDIFNSII